MEQKVIRTIILTGCNKGIGYGILKGLVLNPNYHIIMACRNEQLAAEARTTVSNNDQAIISRLDILPLDIASTDSIATFAE